MLTRELFTEDRAGPRALAPASAIRTAGVSIDPEINRAVRDRIGDDLRTLHEAALNEHLPGRLLVLVSRLERACIRRAQW